MMIDLHVHSTCSDGSFTPTELVDYAIEKNLSAFALTDHDTVDGLDEAINYAAKLRRKSGIGADCPDGTDGAGFVPEVIPGVELSSEYHGKDIHIVGLFIDYQNMDFQAYLKDFVKSRDLRNRKMCNLLQQAGVDISYDALMAEFPGAVITRAHYAKFMLKHGYIHSMNEAFERYIGDHCPCYIPREKVTPRQAVELILKADGIPVLAHPGIYSMGDAALDELTADLKSAGLVGIEALYSTYDATTERHILSLASKYHLLISGGSDFHGSNKPGLDMGTGYGNLHVPHIVLDDLRAAAKKLFFTDLDGTLLKNDSTVSPEMRAALCDMVQAGHRLVISSGRPLPSILEVCEKEKLPLHGTMILAYNGALVWDCLRQRSLLELRISQEDIRFIVEKAKNLGLHIHGYTNQEIVCRGRNEEIEFYTRRIHLPIKEVSNIAAALPDGCCKLLAIHLTDKELLENFREGLAEYCGDRIQMVFSNDRYLEILPAGAGKGNALRFLASYLHIPIPHTYAAGDAENDISMLEAAGTGIAMSNAPEEVKKAAHIVTKNSNDENGLLEILEKYFNLS